MSPDPYARYLEQAESLFASGEVVKAGQIWQAILKQAPEHGAAKEGLLRVREALQAQFAEEAPKPAPPPPPPPAPVPVPMAAAPASPLPIDFDVIMPSEDEKTQGAAAEVPDDQVTAHALPVGDPPAPEPEPVAVAAPPAPAPPPPAPAAPAMSEEDLDKLMREGCTLYDMGQLEDALRKWDRILAIDPGHAMARDYAEGARKELGLPPGAPLPESASEVDASEISGAAPSSALLSEDDADRLMREGCTLYDMGLPDDAILKWEQALKQSPGRKDIQAFLDNARKEMAEESANAPQGNPAVEQKIKQAEHLLGMSRYEEAAYTFQQALAMDPGNAAAQDGLSRSQRPKTGSPAGPSRPAAPAMPPPPPPSAPKPPSAPSHSQSSPGFVIEMDPGVVEQPLPSQRPPSPVQPPAALTKAAPQREGLKLKAPEGLDTSSIPDWVKSPKLWIGVAAGIGLIVVLSMWISSMRRDSQLKDDVQSARQAALAKAAHDAQIPDLKESPASILSEGQSALGSDPVRAYLRAQYALKLNASNSAAAQLLEQAKAALAGGGAVGASQEEYQRHRAEGNLTAAATVMDALLRANPEDAALRREGERLYLALAEDQVMNNRWDDATLSLQRGRALFPEDRSWDTRMALLNSLRGMSMDERRRWVSLLG